MFIQRVEAAVQRLPSGFMLTVSSDLVDDLMLDLMPWLLSLEAEGDGQPSEDQFLSACLQVGPTSSSITTTATRMLLLMLLLDN